MKYLTHIMETKGLLHSFERSAQVLLRYSFGKRNFTRMMAGLGGRENRLRVTFCVTASLLEDHHEFIKAYKGSGHEFAAHGYVHTNMSKKSRKEQAGIIESSRAAFERHGIPVSGFRCPYLSYNFDTLECLEESPFSWTSNNMVFWEGGPPINEARKLGRLYKMSKSSETLSLPVLKGRLLDIPITAPDDEMLIERYRIRDTASIYALWCRVFMKVYERGELFHLLFHPERHGYVSEPIRLLGLFAGGLNPGAWFPTLGMIAEWHEKRRSSRWSLYRNGTGKISLDAPRGSTVLLKSDNGGTHFYRKYRIAAITSGSFSMHTQTPERHMISIPEGAPAELEAFLREEGFFVVRKNIPVSGSLFIGSYRKFRDSDKLRLLDFIDNSPYPLLRLWRWPEGKKCAFTVSSDVDSINIGDFIKRFLRF